MLVKVEAKSVKFSRACVINQGVEVDPPHFDKLHDTISKLSTRKLFHLSLDWYKEMTLEAGVGSSSKHVSSNILLNISMVVDVVHVPWRVALMNVLVEVPGLHVHREIPLLLHIWVDVVAQVALQCSKKTMWLHIDSIVLLCAAVEISLTASRMLQTALEVVLLHALNVLVVADVEVMLLPLPTSRVLLLRARMEITPILCHLGTAHCNSEMYGDFFKKEKITEETYEMSLLPTILTSLNLHFFGRKKSYHNHFFPTGCFFETLAFLNVLSVR